MLGFLSLAVSGECQRYFSWLEKENFNPLIVLLILYMFASHFDLVASKPWGMSDVVRLLLFLS